jgi:predicted metal-dependent peptidase
MSIVEGMPDCISKVCIFWQNNAPFFAEFLLRFNYVQSDSCPTIAVGFRKETQKLMLVYNQKFLDKLKPMEVEGVCYHEILHVLHKFQDRLGVRDMEIFNIAQDACINKIVEETTIKDRALSIPEGGVKLADIQEMGYQGEPISEHVYDFLESKAHKIYIVSTGANGGKGGGKCPTCGGSGQAKGNQENESEEGKDDEKNENGSSGGGNEKKEEKQDSHGHTDGQDANGHAGGTCPTCGGAGQLPKDKIILQTTDDHTQHRNLSEIEQAVVEDIINTARVKSWGSVSGNGRSYIEELFKTKSIPWQRKLAMILSKYVNEPGNIYENTWARRNRRDLPLPGTRKLSKKVVVTVDTSGSIADEDLQKFFGQIEKIVKDFSSMTLIQWDTKVHSAEPYKKGGWKKIKIHGRGGTAIQDLYDKLHEMKKVSVVINFTDTYFDWGFNHYNIPTVWAVVNNPRFEAPFGKTIMIEDDQEAKKRDRYNMNVRR